MYLPEDFVTENKNQEDPTDDSSSPPIGDLPDYSGDDVLVGGPVDDEIAAGGGSDLVEGLGGADSLRGESGDDTLIGGDGDDTLEGGPGGDYLQGEEGADLLTGDDGNDALVGGDGDDELIGGQGRDSLFGEDGRDTLLGGSDADSLEGGNGDDSVIGGDGNDTMNGGSGGDLLNGGAGNDLLAGGADDDFLEGETGNDSLLGEGGGDLLFGSAGNDQLNGGDGDDGLDGGDGDDLLTGGAGDDIISGGPGFDTVSYAFKRNELELAVFGEETIATSQTGGTDILRAIERIRFVDGFEQVIGDHPWVMMSQPALSGKKVATGSNIVLDFSETIVAGSGSLTLVNKQTGSEEDIPIQGNPRVSISGRTLSFDPAGPLNIFTEYELRVGEGAVKDSKGLENLAASVSTFETATVDGLYHFFVVAFSAAPGSIYMGQLGEAYDYFRQTDVADPLKPIVDIFTTKSQFTDVYPEKLTTTQFADQLVANVVKESASPQAKAKAISDIKDAIGFGSTRGDVIYRVFGNLANMPLEDSDWGDTALQFRNQLEVARYLTETMHYASEDAEALRQSIANVTHASDVSSIEKIVELIGSLPPAG